MCPVDFLPIDFTKDKFEYIKRPIAIPTTIKLNIMKFTLPTLVALFTALPAFAYELPKAPFFELSQDLTIEIVTPWSDASMNGGAGVTGDEVKVDDHMYHRLDSFLFEKGEIGAGASFPLWRESWAKHYIGVSLPHTVVLL
jgi:hypothetical protein